MKQSVGFLLIFCCFPLLIFLGSKISEEYSVAKAREQQLEEKIQLPIVENQHPITMVDRNGNIFNEEYIEWRQPLKLEDIPEVIKQIYLVSEDSQFYQHIGFDLSAIMRAVVVNSSEQSIQQGGSTITQQLVRMRYLSEEKSYERKLMELFYAYELETIYTKEQIFEMYLNEIYFGNQVYGIGAAASYYFQKPLSELSLAQMAFIAAIPNNPSLYDPLRNFTNTKARQERLIDILVEHNILTEEEAEIHKLEKITINTKQKIQKSPAYSTFVLEELKWLVAKNEGFDQQLHEATTSEEKDQITKELNHKIDQLLQSGIKIYTALDQNKQIEDEHTINSLLSINGLQASSVVVENNTREIVSIYAGKNYKKYDFHRAYQAARQPGSAFKPLIVYAPLFEETNYTPNSIVSGGRYCVGNFCPQNYGGAVYGNVSISTAFKNSFNTSAVRLLNTIGIETGFQYLDRFNFQSLVKENHTYSAALGGLTYGVTSIEMADAYSSFIDGSYEQIHSIRKVTDLQGNVLYSWNHERETFWSTKTIGYMHSMLNDVVTSGTGRGLYTNSSYIGAKTGTTNDYKDFWLAGLTDRYTAAVWVGFDTPKSMYSLEDDQIHFKIFNTIINN